MTKDIVQKIERGEALTDAELDVAVEFYTDLSSKLDLLGPKFWLATEAVWRAVCYLELIQRARRSS